MSHATPLAGSSSPIRGTSQGGAYGSRDNNHCTPWQRLHVAPQPHEGCTGAQLIKDKFLFRPPVRKHRIHHFITSVGTGPGRQRSRHDRGYDPLCRASRPDAREGLKEPVSRRLFTSCAGDTLWSFTDRAACSRRIGAVQLPPTIRRRRRNTRQVDIYARLTRCTSAYGALSFASQSRKLDCAKAL